MIAFNPNGGSGGVRPPIGGGYGNGGGNMMQMMQLMMFMMKMMMSQFQGGGQHQHQHQQYGQQGYGNNPLIQPPNPGNFYGGAQPNYFA